MSAAQDPMQALRLLWQGVARSCIVTFLIVTFVLALGAFGEANPEAAASITEDLHLFAIAGRPVSAVEPLMLVLVGWATVPYGVVIRDFLRNEGVFQAIRDWRGEHE